MNWVITGGAGFIGVNLIRLLKAIGGQQIRVFDNLSVGTRDDLMRVTTFSDNSAPVAFRDEVQLVVGDIMDAGAMAAACADADVLVHLAANTGVGPSVEDPRTDCMTNVVGILNALEGAREHEVKRFVFASSGAPVGECDPPIHEEKVARPVSPYGASKLAGEGYCSAYNRTFGIETIALRFGNVYGPYSGKKASVVAKFIKQAQDGETLEIYGDGNQTRDFIFVEDLVGAIIKAVKAENVGGEIFQIASARESTLLELMEALHPLLNEMIDGEVPLIYGEKRLGDVMRNFSDTTKAKERLDWTAATDLRDGLQQTIAWFS